MIDRLIGRNEWRRKKTFGLAVLAGDLDAAGDVLTDANATIDRVCLPLPSVADTKMPQNEIAQCYEEIAAQHSIQSAQFAKLERQFALGSVYRPFLVRPANVQWELLSYTSDTEELQQCEFIPSSDALRAPKRHDMDGGDDNDKKQHLPTKKALRISFDLPSGTYATVALRELMRTDFDKKAQKELEQEMLTMNNGKGEKDANGGCGGGGSSEVEMSGDQQKEDGDDGEVEQNDGTEQQAKRIRINC
uniref:TRUD domain-containing protein n=1 Tax=Globodera pallida TaxID=36090 RepID=A0A183BPD5_GLOPA